MADPTRPNAKSTVSPNELQKLRRVVIERDLCGLANDTKWDELIRAIQARSDWRPSYRYQCIDGPPSDWDCEWFYHLPFPMRSVEWLDIAFGEKTDFAIWLTQLLIHVGLDYRVGDTMIRVFGYSPRNLKWFDEGR